VRGLLNDQPRVVRFPLPADKPRSLPACRPAGCVSSGKDVPDVNSTSTVGTDVCGQRVASPVRSPAKTLSLPFLADSADILSAGWLALSSPRICSSSSSRGAPRPRHVVGAELRGRIFLVVLSGPPSQPSPFQTSPLPSCSRIVPAGTSRNETSFFVTYVAVD